MYSDVVRARHSFSRPPRINTPRFSERIPVVYQLSALGPVSWAQPTSALKCVFLESLSAAMGSCWQESLTALEGLLVRCLLGTNADPHATRFLSSSSSLSSPSISPPWARVTTACKAGTLCPLPSLRLCFRHKAQKDPQAPITMTKILPVGPQSI